MGLRAASLMLLLSAGCFAPDLGEGQVTCGAAGICPPGYLCRGDGHCYHSEGSADLGRSGDLALACAVDGTRVCVDQTHSGVCQGGAPTLDRECPPGSSCAGDRCAPPAGGTACVRSSDCNGGSVCDEYAVGGGLSGVCTAPVPGATGGSTASCSAPGNDLTCGTGICARGGNGPPVRACLYPCKNQNDCSGHNCQPLQMPSTIEGASTAGLKFCAN